MGGARTEVLLDGAAGNGCGDGCVAARERASPWPDMDPMPEAWRESPYEGPPARSSGPTASTLERCLDTGDLDAAARWLAPGPFNVRELRRRDTPSWNARHALAQARYDLMRAYESVHGEGCLRSAEHRSAIALAWHPFGASAAFPVNEGLP